MKDHDNDLFYGVWWIPDNPKKIYGILIVNSGDRATFETSDSFLEEAPQPFLVQADKHEVLFGMASSLSDNKDYSFRLYSLIQVNQSSQIFTKSKYAVPRVLKASANPDYTSNTFGSLRLSSMCWKHWVKSDGLKRERLWDDETKFGHKIEYRQPAAITLFKSDGDHAYIYFRAKSSFNQEHDFVLTEAPYLNFEFNTPKNLKEIVHLKTSLERFFMILWEKAHLFDKFDVRSSAGTDFENIIPIQKLGTGWDMKYDFETFIKNSQALLQKWFAVAEEEKLIINTFFFAYADYQMAVENRFLNYLFALELFHRKKIRAKEPLAKKNERMYLKTMGMVKGDVKQWLQDKLTGDKEIELNVRLSELLNRIDDTHDIKLSEAIRKRCIQTRHYLVHLDEKHADQSFNGEELLKVNGSLETLMLRLLKKELLEVLT